MCYGNGELGAVQAIEKGVTMQTPTLGRGAVDGSGQHIYRGDTVFAEATVREVLIGDDVVVVLVDGTSILLPARCLRKFVDITKLEDDGR